MGCFVAAPVPQDGFCVSAVARVEVTAGGQGTRGWSQCGAATAAELWLWPTWDQAERYSVGISQHPMAMPYPRSKLLSYLLIVSRK